MFKWITNYFHGINRSTDMTTLWPICKQHAQTLDHAKAAFYMHVVNDPAWTDHYSEPELIAFVDALQ